MTLLHLKPSHHKHQIGGKSVSGVYYFKLHVSLSLLNGPLYKNKQTLSIEKWIEKEGPLSFEQESFCVKQYCIMNDPPPPQ